MASDYGSLSQIGDKEGGFVPQSQVRLPSQQARASSALRQPVQREGKTTRFVTIKQLTEADRDSNGDLIVDGQRIDALDVVCIVGQVNEVRQTSMKAVFTVHDGSGVAEVVWPFGTDGSDTVFVPVLLPELLAAASSGQRRFICAHCWLRSDGVDRYLLAMKIRLVTDFNEVTHHGLRVIFEHLWIKREAEKLEQELEEQVMRSTQQHATQQAAASQEAAAPKQAPASQQLAPQTPEKSHSTRPGFNRLHDAVYDTLARPQVLSHGMTRDEVASHLGNRWNVNAIGNALAWLEAEGHAFMAPDGEHYCSATNQ